MTGAMSRRGVALVAALVLLAVTGILVAGSVASSVLAQRAARLSASDAELTAAADDAIGAVLGASDALDLADLPFGVPTAFAIPEPWSAAATVAVSVTRLPSSVLWIVADARAPSADAAERRVNVIARFPTIGPVPGAAVVARGNVRAAAGVSFSVDSAGDPSCAAAAGLAPAADVLLGSGASLTAGDGITASSSSAASDTATYYLAAWQRAAIDSAGVGAVHVRGDTSISGGTFAGVMVIDGTLTVTGAWTVTGVVAAGGRIDVASGAVTLTGAITSFAPVASSPAIDLGAGAIRFSPCTVARALRRAVAPRPLPQRSWVELF